MAENIATLSEEKLKELLEDTARGTSHWGAIHLVEELNRRAQNRLTTWLVVASVTSAVATIINLYISISKSCQ